MVFPPGSFHRDVSPGTNLVNVFAPKDVPRHAISFGSLGQGTFESRRTLLAGTHRIAVVLDDVDDRKLEECSQIQRFVKGTLINSAVSQVTETAALNLLVFDGVGDASAQGSLPTHDAVAAPIPLIRREEVHRAAFAL